MNETNTLLRQILEALKAVPSGDSLRTATGNVPREPIGTPSAKQLALDWLNDHPEDRQKSTRWLEDHARPMGVKLGKSTWARAKTRRRK